MIDLNHTYEHDDIGTGPPSEKMSSETIEESGCARCAIPDPARIWRGTPTDVLATAVLNRDHVLWVLYRLHSRLDDLIGYLDSMVGSTGDSRMTDIMGSLRTLIREVEKERFDQMDELFRRQDILDVLCPGHSTELSDAIGRWVYSGDDDRWRERIRDIEW